jgi:hypothetical protein
VSVAACIGLFSIHVIDEVGPGLKAIFETIDNRTDFKSYMQNYAVARQHRGPRREGPYEEGFVSLFPLDMSASLHMTC